jgi:hypothetical protein
MQAGFGDVEISGGSLQIAVAKQKLNAAQIGASVEKMGREAVPPIYHAK